MAEFLSIALADIHVPERLRGVEEAHAQAMMMSIAQHGLLQPVGVRRTPNGAAKFTLVWGAHRLRAVTLFGAPQIDAVVVEADRNEAQLKEITENLFRNDLSVIDRAVFVASYRELWEQKFGKIKPGRNAIRVKDDPNSEEPVQVAPVFESPVDILAADAADGFNAHVAERMGISKQAVKRLGYVAKLHPTLREKLRGSPQADNQGFLIGLSRKGPDDQLKFAQMIDVAEGDVGKAANAMRPYVKKLPRDEAAYAKIIDLLGRTNRQVRARVAQWLEAHDGQA